MGKKEYSELEIEIIRFENCDVVAMSGTNYEKEDNETPIF